MTGELWNTGDVLTADKLNKLCNTVTSGDVADGLIIPSTIGDANFQFDSGKEKIELSKDGGNWNLQIPLVVGVPATATSAGVKGQFAADASGNYLYYCVADDTWVRAAFATF